MTSARKRLYRLTKVAGMSGEGNRIAAVVAGGTSGGNFAVQIFLDVDADNFVERPIRSFRLRGRSGHACNPQFNGASCGRYEKMC
jgi:hypothetical protein